MNQSPPRPERASGHVPPSVRGAGPTNGRPQHSRAQLAATGEVVPLRNDFSLLICIAITVGVVAAGALISYLLFDRESTGLAITFSIATVLAGPVALWWLGVLEWLDVRRPNWLLDHIPAPPGLYDATRIGVDSLDSYRRSATININALVEQVIYDYGLLLTGQQPELAYASNHVATVLRQSVAPVLRSGERIRPDFGNHVDVTIDWHQDDVGQPVTATAYFVDMSTRISESGLGVKLPTKRMRLAVAFDHQFTHIIDATIGPA